jgi:hypothetical protein
MAHSSATMCDDFKELINEGKSKLILYLEQSEGNEIYKMIRYAVDLLQPNDLFFQKLKLYVLFTLQHFCNHSKVTQGKEKKKIFKVG